MNKPSKQCADNEAEELRPLCPAKWRVKICAEEVPGQQWANQQNKNYKIACEKPLGGAVDKHWHKWRQVRRVKEYRKHKESRILFYFHLWHISSAFFPPLLMICVFVWKDLHISYIYMRIYIGVYSLALPLTHYPFVVKRCKSLLDFCSLSTEVTFCKRSVLI